MISRIFLRLLLFLGSSLLGGLLSSRLLCHRLLCRRLLSSRLLSGGLLGSLLCSGFLSSGLLGSRLLGGFLGWLLCSGLLGLRLLGCGLFSGKLEGAGTLLAGSSGGHQTLGGNQLLQREPDSHGSLGRVNLVVGHHVLEDGLAGASLLVTERLDGGLDHGGVGRVGGGHLGLGGFLGGCGRHVVCCYVASGGEQYPM